MRCLIYTRVSLDPRGEGRSPAEQEDECRAWAAREGWTVQRIITETGSASRYARTSRTHWQDVTTALQAGDIDILLTWEASRATRQLDEYAALRDLCAKHGVQWGYSGTLYDLTRRDDRFRTGLDALLSEDESARSSERVQRSVRARAAAGKPHGKLPYGYRREYDPGTGALLRQVPNEETAPIVREIYRRIIDGDTLYQLARDFDARGIAPPRPPRTQRPLPQLWLPISVRRIILSPTYKARRTHRGHDVGPATWAPLVDDHTWDTANAIVTSPGRMTRVSDSLAKYLLTGIATCSECGAPMRRVKNRGYHSYSCMRSGCMKVTRSMDRVDRHVNSVMVTLLGEHSAQLQAATNGPTHANTEVEAVRGEIRDLRARLEGFVDAAAEGTVSPTALARIENKVQPQIRAAERRLHMLMLPSSLAGLDLSDPEALWKRLDVGQCRSIIRDLVNVTIHPVGRGANIKTFDTSKIKVTPRW